jgi:hypothetical protein
MVSFRALPRPLQPSASLCGSQEVPTHANRDPSGNLPASPRYDARARRAARDLTASRVAVREERGRLLWPAGFGARAARCSHPGRGYRYPRRTRRRRRLGSPPPRASDPSRLTSTAPVRTPASARTLCDRLRATKPRDPCATLADPLKAPLHRHAGRARTAQERGFGALLQHSAKCAQVRGCARRVRCGCRAMARS